MICLLKLLGYLLVCFVSLMFLKDLYCYILWHRKYRSQGIQLEYVPLLGFHYYLLVALHPIFEKMGSLKRYMPFYYSQKDSGVKFKQLEEKRRGQDIVAMNHMEGQPTLLLLNPELIQEAMLKDNDVLLRHLPIEIPIGSGFFNANGAAALHTRGVLAKFFQFDSLMSLTPKIVKIIVENISKIKKSFPLSEEQFPEGFAHAGK